jgi:pyridoxine 5'-phosphate synthase PdxJ
LAPQSDFFFDPSGQKRNPGRPTVEIAEDMLLKYVTLIAYCRLTELILSPNLARMARITIDLEPLANLYPDGLNMIKAVLKNGLACEIAGADSIMFGLGKEYDQRRRKAASLLIESLDIALAIRCGTDNRSLEAVQDLKPALMFLKYASERKEALSTAITGLQVENILVGMEVALDVDQIKEAARLKCDYAFLDCEQFCSARTVNAQLDELGKISKMAGLAARLSMGVAVIGDFTPIHISKLRDAAQIEEYVMGLPFISNALIHGYEKTMEILRHALT